MNKDLKADKVFISYSWAMPGREDWVLELAYRLVYDGVEVVLDKWDSVEGQNLNAFMQRCVNDPSIQKVLVICDEVYTKKADGFEGGVGTETVIISNEVYKDVEQTKFIPIVAHRGLEGEVYIPTYLGGTKYIDISSEQNYEDGYEKLIRNLYHKPEYERPSPGNPPKYLLKDQESVKLDSGRALKTFLHLAEKNPNKVNMNTYEFFKVFRDDFSNYSIKEVNQSDLEDKVYSSYHEMMGLRDIYIEFFDNYIRLTEEFKVQLVIDFFESLYPLIEKKEESGSYFTNQFDHMKIFVTEIVIYTIAILYKYDVYEGIKELIKNHYFVTDSIGRNKEGSIGLFKDYPQLLEERQPHSKNKRYISYSGQLFRERASFEGVDFSDFVQADFLLYLLTYRFGKFEVDYGWFPPTLPYFTSQKIKFINRLKSKRYFEKAKELLEVSEVEQTQALMKGFQKHLKENRSRDAHYSYDVEINPEEIAIY